MEKPVPFIESVSGRLTLNEEAVKVLRDIRNPVTVVAIAGLYRTGKSYILNRMFGLYRIGRSFLMNKLYGETTQFELGSTIQAKTKGIWIWCRPHPLDSEHYLVLLDTEGLGDPEMGDPDHDIAMFSLAVLLSSCFIYNSIGTINQYAINELHLVTELTDHIKVKASATEETGEKFDEHFPTFIWVVRDFTLQKIINGKAVTSDEYLENCLQLKTGTSKKVLDYNLPRETLKNFFPTRNCFTMPRPCSDEKLGNVESLPDNEINPEFLERITELNYFVYRNAPAKTFEGKKISGSMLADLTAIYMDAIASGKIPCIETAFETIGQTECKKATSEGISKYLEIMTNGIDMPTTLKTMSLVHEEAFKSAMDIFCQRNIFDKDHINKKKFLEMIETHFQTFEKTNAKESENLCEELLKKLYEPIKSRCLRGDFICPGGYAEYLTTRKELEKKYKETKNKGIRADAVYARFREKVMAEETQIMAADNSMSEQERVAADKESRLEAVNANTAALELNRRRLEEANHVKQRNFDIQIAELNRNLEQTRAHQKQLNVDLKSDHQRYSNELGEARKKQTEYYENEIKSMRGVLDQESQKKKDLLKQIENLKKQL